jgi:formylglycine-generating enzyme required for sulfatase activity/serine/threonine protein kinase
VNRDSDGVASRLASRPSLGFLSIERRTQVIKEGAIRLEESLMSVEPPREEAGSTVPIALPDQFGPYRILTRLGQGGMGSVFLARDTRLDRDVALKVCHVADKPQAMERFRREAKAAALLSHPNLCPVHEFDVRDGIAYLTMAFIEGPTLSEWARANPLDQRKAALLVAKLALAMQEAHEAGIVHRDLKPGNVGINKKGEPVILDFGLARQVREGPSHLTQLGSVYGTPSYMAPEQASGDPTQIGPSCDIYSLGVILYELLTGSVPFAGSAMQILAQLFRNVPEPLRQRKADIDPRLEAVCLKVLAKNPADRYGSMADFARALTAVAASLPRETAPARALPDWLPPSTAPNLAQGTTEPTPPAVPPSQPIESPSPVVPPLAEEFEAPPSAGLNGPVFWILAVVALLIGVAVYLALFFASRTAATPTTAAGAIPGALESPAKTEEATPQPEPRGPAVMSLKFREDQGGMVEMEFARIPRGSFVMGSPPDEPGRDPAEESSHEVELACSFYLCKTEVTVGQFRAFVGEDIYRTSAEIARDEMTWRKPGFDRKEDEPVVHVSWVDADRFCKWMSIRTRKSVRLPTEAEWERAGRGGVNNRRFHFGDDDAQLGQYAWHASNSEGRTHSVGRKNANPYGLFDMHGNVAEWCANRNDPPGAASGQRRPIRGGSWHDDATRCRAAFRQELPMDAHFATVGFRVCFTAE